MPGANRAMQTLGAERRVPLTSTIPLGTAIVAGAGVGVAPPKCSMKPLELDGFRIGFDVAARAAAQRGNLDVDDGSSRRAVVAHRRLGDVEFLHQHSDVLFAGGERVEQSPTGGASHGVEDTLVGGASRHRGELYISDF